MTDRPRARPATSRVAGLAALVVLTVPLAGCRHDAPAPPPPPTGTVHLVTTEEDGRVRLDVRYPDGDEAPVRVTPGSPCATVGAEFPTCHE